MFSLEFSLYLIYHIILLFFSFFFYFSETIHKIWIMKNYPDLNFYLLYGFIIIMIGFAVHKIFSFLINNDIRIRKMRLIPTDNVEEIEYRYNYLICCSKVKIIIFFIFVFPIIAFCGLYIFIFCGIFPATVIKAFELYGISLIMIIIIKIVYGIILGILRKISLEYKIKKLYKVVLFFDLYIN